MAFGGSCHCGGMAFAVDGDMPTAGMACNCSHCGRKGFILTFVPAETFRLEKGAELLTRYMFNKHRIEHLFCRDCGVQAFAEGKMPDGSPMRAINLRCVDGIDVDALEIEHVDGKSF